MEKYTKYRDKGSGIAPFFPIPSTPSGFTLPLHLLLFIVRLPLLLCAILSYLLIFSWLLPHGSLGRKAILWTQLGIMGIWWVDLQIDGVKRGTLNRTTSAYRLPRPGSIIASSSTSPLDALYLAAIFDPVIIRAYPATRRVHRISLLHAVTLPLLPSCLDLSPSPTVPTTTVAHILRENPHRPLLMFPETTPTNGRAILPLSPALLGAQPSPIAGNDKATPIFPTSLRYSPADITTPVPGRRAAWWFVWNLCKAPNHTIRVRIAEPVFTEAGAGERPATMVDRRNGYEANFFDRLNEGLEGEALKRRGGAWVDPDAAELKKDGGGAGEDGDGDGAEDDERPPTAEERRVLDRVGEALARLGRVKQVALGVRDKGEFVKLWRRRSSRR